MPIYQFECTSCKEGFEQYLSLRRSENPPCRSCGQSTERVWALGVKHKGSDVFPYVTRNLRPDGKPVEVTSPGHLDSLCKQFGVTHRPDVAWLEKTHEGCDRRGNPIYKEGSGRGMPGSWI